MSTRKVLLAVLIVLAWCAVPILCDVKSKAPKGQQDVKGAKAPQKKEAKTEEAPKGSANGKPELSGTTKVEFGGTLTVEDPVTEELVQCRDGTGEPLRMARCFEQATLKKPGNYSWLASLSLLYLRSGLLSQAKQSMNRSMTTFVQHYAPLFENETSAKKQIRYVDILRRVYDDAMDRNDTAQRSDTLEMGLMMAKYFEIDHLATDTASIYFGFLLQLGQGEQQVLDFHRRTGNIIGMISLGKINETSIAFRVSEAIAPVVDGVQEDLMSFEKVDPAKPPQRMCGIPFTDVDELLETDLISKALSCVEKYGNYTEYLAKDEPEDLGLQWFGPARVTPLHRFAMYGATNLLKESILFYDSHTIPGDRYGRGLLHYAAAYGHADTVQMLLQQGSRDDREDRGRIKPFHLGCSSPGFREEFEEMVGEGRCDGNVRSKIEDSDVEVTDDSGKDGEWNVGRKRPMYLHSDVDIRDASRMTAQDVLMGYVMSNWPGIMRNTFFDTDGPAREWKRKRFNQLFGSVLIRRERYPGGERFGLGEAKVSTIEEFLASKSDGTIGSINVDHEKHPLFNLTAWTPKVLTAKKMDNEITIFDPDSAVPLLLLLKEQSASNHYIRAYITTLTVIYGHLDVVLLPPKLARALRGPVPDKLLPQSLRCTVYTGDTLIVPPMWSMSYVSRANGVAIERYVHWGAPS